MRGRKASPLLPSTPATLYTSESYLEVSPQTCQRLFFCLSDGNFSAFARLFNKLNFGWWERDGWRWFLKVEDGPCSTPKSGERKDRHGHRLQGNTTEYCFCCCLMTFQRDVSQKALLWVLVNSEGVKSLMYFGTCNEGVWIINASSSVAFI